MKAACALLGALTVFACSAAWADAISPEEQVCTSKAPGDPCAVSAGQLATTCGDGSACACADASCSRIQYVCPDATADAASPGCQPDGTRTVDCLKCGPGPVQPPADGGEPSVDGGPPSVDGGEPPPGDHGHGMSCASGYEASLRGFGPWLLASAVALAVGRRRRRD